MSMREYPQPSAAWSYTAPTPMPDEMFAQWSQLLEGRTGISLPETRKTFLLTNLSIRMRELGMTDYQQYLDLIKRGAHGQVEWETLVDRLTVHETRFFRDVHALNFLRDVALPEILRNNQTPYTVNMWSVGCATGEEPYSLAMMADHFFNGKPKGYYYGITASDISRTALQSARKALYHKNRIKNVPDQFALRYLQTVDDQHVQVKTDLQQKICFLPINMLQLEKQPVGKMDFLVCQNVLIYFKQELRQRVLEQLVTHLKPGGFMVLGPGEIVGWVHPELKAIPHPQLSAFQRQPMQQQGN